MYGTTRKFLEYFGLNSLNELPKLEKEQPYEEALKEAVQEEALSESSPAEENVVDKQGEEDGLKQVT